MTSCNNATHTAGFPGKAAARVSMISMMAIAIGIGSAPVQAQSTIEPSDMPIQSPVAAPDPAPVPVTEPAPVMIMPVTKAKPSPPVTSDRADTLATDGGFDAATVAPEALAQIEAEKQARKSAAAKSASAARVAAAERAPTVARNSDTPVDSSAGTAGNSASHTLAAAEPAPVAGFESAPSVVQPGPAASDTVTAPADISGESDWTLLAALVGLLALGGVGVYAATRRRKHKDQPVAREYAADGREPERSAVAAAIMPELRRDPVGEAESLPRGEPSAGAKAHLTDFVAGLPSFEEPGSKADHHITIGQRRVAAAPRPYLGEADLSRRPGYFMAHVDAIPTPQNPFLTRQKRLKRARHLDAKLTEMKAAQAMNPTRITGNMQVTRPMAPAYS